MRRSAPSGLCPCNSSLRTDGSIKPLPWKETEYTSWLGALTDGFCVFAGFWLCATCEVVVKVIAKRPSGELRTTAPASVAEAEFAWAIADAAHVFAQTTETTKTIRAIRILITTFDYRFLGGELYTRHLSVSNAPGASPSAAP